MSQYAPKFFPGQSISLTADGDIDGGDCVVVAGNGTVETSSEASGAFVGVAVSDVKSGDPVAVFTQGVHRLTAVGGITAGNQVVTATGGGVAAAAPLDIDDGSLVGDPDVIGVALTTALDGATCLVRLS